MKYFACIESAVILTEQQWKDGGYDFSKLQEVVNRDGKWVSLWCAG